MKVEEKDDKSRRKDTKMTSSKKERERRKEETKANSRTNTRATAREERAVPAPPTEPAVPPPPQSDTQSLRIDMCQNLIDQLCYCEANVEHAREVQTREAERSMLGVWRIIQQNKRVLAHKNEHEVVRREMRTLDHVLSSQAAFLPNLQSALLDHTQQYSEVAALANSAVSRLPLETNVVWPVDPHLLSESLAQCEVKLKRLRAALSRSDHEATTLLSLSQLLDKSYDRFLDIERSLPKLAGAHNHESSLIAHRLQAPPPGTN